MSKPRQTVTGGSNVFGKLTDQLTFFDRNERTRQRCDQKGHLYGLCCLCLKMPNLTETSALIDKLSLKLANNNDVGGVDCMTWLNANTLVMTFQLSNEDRIVSRAVELHLFLEKFAQNYPKLRHYLGVTVSMVEKDSIDEMIRRATIASTKGFRNESEQQSGTVRFDKHLYHEESQASF